MSGDGRRLGAVLAHRSATAFAAILATLMRGCGYVPLHPDFPIERTRLMLERSGCASLIVDADSEALLPDLLSGISRRLAVLLADRAESRELTDRFPQHTILSVADARKEPNERTASAEPSSIAYLLFTSGSTGVPKAVMVAHRNVIAFVEEAANRYGIDENDRFSQTFDLTFDLSVFDMFVAWRRGACVCCPSSRTLLNPAKFIRESELTVWFSVPSVAALMKRLGSLKEGAFPTLRRSLFCGEALPVSVAEAWAKAAPGSFVENLYGPTELTIACTAHRFDPARTSEESEGGLVAIGMPLGDMEAIIVDESLLPVSPGQAGELLMTGPQLTPGYLDDPPKTAAAFTVPPGKKEIYYRTGDLVREIDDQGTMVFLGRVDHQIKVNGYRVELGEIEAAVREASSVDEVVALGWPSTSTGAGAIVVALAGLKVDVEQLKARLQERLPKYAAPRSYYCFDRLPMTPNGKVDRRAVIQWLEDSA